ncbi:MAG: hypothetical protein U0361_20690 [Nitrospiraceae bacterium]
MGFGLSYGESSKPSASPPTESAASPFSPRRLAISILFRDDQLELFLFLFLLLCLLAFDGFQDDFGQLDIGQGHALPQDGALSNFSTTTAWTLLAISALFSGTETIG